MRSGSRLARSIVFSFLGFFFLIPALLSFFAAAKPSKYDSSGIEELNALFRAKSGMEIQLPDLGWEWREEDVKGTPDKGEITFSDRKWMMYLIHWGPIQRPDITADYVKERMLKMWGVDFEFSGKSGITEISGHKAVWVEAFGTNRAFTSRFIVWNCPQSGREIIADTNFNLRLKTPAADFEDQWFSAHTISCHEAVVSRTYPSLDRRFDSLKHRISFLYPERWFIIDSPFYVPFPEYEGIRDHAMGSLLGLPSDQNISVTIRWYPSAGEEKGPIVMGVDRHIIEFLNEEMRSRPEIQESVTRGQERFSVSGKPVHRIWGDYSAAPADNKNEAGPPEKGMFQAAQWNLENKHKKIVVILRSRVYQYSGVSSTPSRDALDLFLVELIRSMK